MKTLRTPQLRRLPIEFPQDPQGERQVPIRLYLVCCDPIPILDRSVSWPTPSVPVYRRRTRLG